MVVEKVLENKRIYNGSVIYDRKEKKPKTC